MVACGVATGRLLLSGTFHPDRHDVGLKGWGDVAGATPDPKLVPGTVRTWHVCFKDVSRQAASNSTTTTRRIGIIISWAPQLSVPPPACQVCKRDQWIFTMIWFSMNFGLKILERGSDPLSFISVCMISYSYSFLSNPCIYSGSHMNVHLIQALSIEVADANVQSLWWFMIQKVWVLLTR